MNEIEKKYQNSLKTEKEYSKTKCKAWLMKEFERLGYLGYKTPPGMDIKRAAEVWEEELHDTIVDYGFEEVQNAFREYTRNHDYGFPTLGLILSHFNGVPSPRNAYKKMMREKELDEKEKIISDETMKQLESDKQIVMSLPIEERYKWLEQHYPGCEAEFAEEMNVPVKDVRKA